MKTAILSLAAVLATATAFGQANPGEQRISSPPPGALNSNTTSRNGETSPQGSLTATNQAVQGYAIGELGSQLTNLKTAVEQTLPTLTAFNARFASANPGSSRSQQLANAISGVLSSALGRNSNSTSSGTSSLTNFTQALNGLINTNSASAGSTNLNPATLGQLRTLQADLTPVLNILQNLDLGSSANTLPNAQGSPAFSRRGAAPGQTPTPTGR